MPASTVNKQNTRHIVLPVHYSLLVIAMASKLLGMASKLLVVKAFANLVM